MRSVPECFYRVSTKALILDDTKRFLLTKEKCGKWELPGGGLDFGETAQIGITREIKEEMGLEVIFVANNPSYFFTFQHDRTGTWIANVLYLTKVKNLEFTSSNECTELRFFTKEEALKENLFSNVTAFVELYNPEN